MPGRNGQQGEFTARLCSCCSQPRSYTAQLFCVHILVLEAQGSSRVANANLTSTSHGCNATETACPVLVLVPAGRLEQPETTRTTRSGVPLQTRKRPLAAATRPGKRHKQDTAESKAALPAHQPPAQPARPGRRQQGFAQPLNNRRTATRLAQLPDPDHVRQPAQQPKQKQARQRAAAAAQPARSDQPQHPAPAGRAARRLPARQPPAPAPGLRPGRKGRKVSHASDAGLPAGPSAPPSPGRKAQSRPTSAQPANRKPPGRQAAAQPSHAAARADLAPPEENLRTVRPRPLHITDKVGAALPLAANALACGAARAWQLIECCLQVRVFWGTSAPRIKEVDNGAFAAWLGRAEQEQRQGADPASLVGSCQDQACPNFLIMLSASRCCSS